MRLRNTQLSAFLDTRITRRCKELGQADVRQVRMASGSKLLFRLDTLLQRLQTGGLTVAPLSFFLAQPGLALEPDTCT
jgi:hypothetical protein